LWLSSHWPRSRNSTPARIGERLEYELPAGLERERGSIIVILATDAPLLPHQLKRLAQRAGLGIALASTPGGNNSGDISSP